jgi:hypothetical protein
MAPPGANLLKRMKLGGTRCPEEFIPGIRPKPGDTREARFYVAKLNRANQPGEIGTKAAQTRIGVPVLADGDHKKDRRPRKRTGHRLRKSDLI